jgi:hypothetical protein
VAAPEITQSARKISLKHGREDIMDVILARDRNSSVKPG